MVMILGEVLVVDIIVTRARNNGLVLVLLRAVGPLVAAALLTWGAFPSTARAGLLTNFEKNAFAMAETAALTTSMIEQQYGSPTSTQTLTFSSTSFSDVGWSFNLTGMYLGRTINNLTFSGSFNTSLNQGTFSSTMGTIGTDTWSGSGSWSYASLAPDTDGLTFDSSVTINGLLGIFDRDTLVPKRELTTDNGTIRHTVSQGQFFRTIFGVRVGNLIDETDDSIGPSPGNGTATVAVALIQDHISLSGSFDQSGGQIRGTVQVVVPEPSSMLLLGSGLAGLGAVAWKRHRVKHADRARKLR